MVKALDHLAGCKFGPVTGANLARKAFLRRCAQLISVGAMRGVAEVYYKVQTLSHYRLKRNCYQSFDPTTNDFDTPSTEGTPFKILRRPSNRPLRISCVALSELVRYSRASLTSASSQPRADPDPPTTSRTRRSSVPAASDGGSRH